MLLSLLAVTASILLEGAAAPVPIEVLPGVTVSYETLVTDGGRETRGVWSRPTSATGRLPGLLLAGWLSCDPVEVPVDDKRDGTARLLHGIAQHSGFVFLRVEKPGMLPGQIPRCEDSDFETDLAAYRAGLRALLARSDVDPQRVFILGLSNGGGIAPLVAGELPVAGYVVSGGWARTWLEHMLELERRRLTLSGRPPGEVSTAMKGFADFYSLYLNGRLAPADVFARRPDLKRLWYDEPTRQYGRPAAFYHQLQSLNLAEAWARVSVPVLAVYGEQDWIMSREDHQMIVDLVNRNRPGQARLVVMPRMDHFYSVHDTPEQAFRDEPRGRYAEDVEPVIVGWLRATAGLAPLKGSERPVTP